MIQKSDDVAIFTVVIPNIGKYDIKYVRKQHQ